MAEVPHYDYVNPITVHDILWSWSQGHIPTEKASEMLSLEPDESIYEIAQDNDVPFPVEAESEHKLSQGRG